jgi:predicted transcriptional regulator
MIRLVDVPLASSTDSIECLMEQMGEHEDTRALIMDGDQVVGVVSPSDIARLTIAIELADAQNREGRTPRETADR